MKIYYDDDDVRKAECWGCTQGYDSPEVKQQAHDLLMHESVDAAINGWPKPSLRTHTRKVTGSTLENRQVARLNNDDMEALE